MLKKCSEASSNGNSLSNRLIVAFIPVRGGSKSILNKNIKEFCGKPLVYWVVDAAQKCSEIDVVYVSTDNPQIRREIERLNFKKVKVVDRSPTTATDEATTESAMLEFSQNHVYDDIILIQATSPLLTAEDLTNGIERYRISRADSLLSVTRQKRFQWNCNEQGAVPLNYNPSERPRRQDWQGFFVENGAFYITSKESLEQTGVRISGKMSYYEMPECTYFEVDEPEDWVIIENLKRRQLQKHGHDNLKFNQINLLICDVDGVLTDSGMYYSENGDELKKFNTRDGKGIELIREAGIRTMILTSEDRDLVKRRAEKLKIDFLFMGVKDKKTSLEEFFRLNPEYGFSRTVFIGDDLNDEECLKACFISAVPADGIDSIKKHATYNCALGGGMGCVREVSEWILKGRGHE